MKKILIFLLLVQSIDCFSNYTTPGTGRNWTLDSLVAFSSGNVTFSSGNYMINDTITISVSDTLKILTNATMKFGTSVFIDIFGVMIVNAPDSATMTAQDTTLKYLGLKFEDQSDGSVLKRLIFEFGNSIRMLDCNILIDSCIIRHNRLNSTFASSAINFFRSNSIVSNCQIYRNRRSALASGANIASSPQILNNLIYENNTDNANVPQINFGATASSPMIIRGNTIINSSVMAGGISFLPVGSIPSLIIENNIIKKNRYGIAIAGGSSNVYINNNIIDSNNIQGSPNLGGSGINFNGSATQNSIVTRNIIRGNLWGITIQGTAKPNMGDLASSDTTDAGLNQIYNNGNTGKIYDLYNNTPDPIKAENNWWGTGIVDSVEAHIFHNADSSALGNVDYLPLRSININVKILMEGMYDQAADLLARRDTVSAYVRETVSPYGIVDSARSAIDSVSFTGNFLFTSAPSSQYYVEVNHFNCIRTWSEAGGEQLISNSAVVSNYDFTNGVTKAYGNNMIQKGSRYCIYSGDITRDDAVDLSDIVIAFNDASVFASGIRLPSDLNGDNTVDLSDIIFAFNNSANFVRVVSPINP